ncbi:MULTISPECIES: glycosyltransferase family 1 protein [unclassified Microbacterium]|uniref:glycosyltransferase family 1 protein n=1 Tax=unclassified Microbacterium TaxID=2609290 RepID=UPI00214B6C04|nr:MULTISPECIES: glycosyltransferase family 1 protein [unclassified Microbacterium]MCR2810266.1 glycosyltransferase family 1 protein [Microbacterium sp. zg.B185]WIM19905.1 glycosyltransferase family 1 protein [Microbacterium sp. zg-B185]
MKPTLLILSFSPIAGDARVLKQVDAFSNEYTVTTCGYGPAPHGVAGHVQIPDDILHNVLDDRYVTRKAYRRAYWRLWSVEWAKKHLRPRSWDIVLANDVEAVPLALRLKPRKGVHADLHEYSPLLHEDWEGWRERITPYVDWVCSTYVSRASSWTTVSRGLSREYERNFGFHAELVTNAAPYLDVSPTPVGDTIRLVHSGAALQDRRLHDLITAVTASSAPVTLDMYLTPNQPAYLAQLREAAAASGGRVRVNDPVPYSLLAETLCRFDVGIHVLAPTNFNNTWALPNKLFDYVQARLGIIVGPTPEMAEYVRRFGLGPVTDDFDPQSLTRVLDALTAADVRAWKAAADRAAPELSAQAQVEIWRAAIARLVAVN